jgi:hypothetical protein
VYVALSMGPWVLLIGLMRYVFVAAAKVAPWLNNSLPHSMARKTVAAVQGVFLLVAASGLLPYAAGFGLVALALGSLLWSFGRDVAWLFRNREVGGETTPATTTAPETVTVAVAVAAPSGRRTAELVSS